MVTRLVKVMMQTVDCFLRNECVVLQMKQSLHVWSVHGATCASIFGNDVMHCWCHLEVTFSQVVELGGWST